MKPVIRCASLIMGLLVLGRAPVYADHPLKVLNAGDHTIFNVYISGVGEQAWGPDQLESSEVIRPGQSWNVTINQGCAEDVKLVYDDGTDREQRGFDTCAYDLRSLY